MEFDKTLLAGSTGMMVLKLLEQEDMYGYQMIETLRERSEHSFDLKAGTLYPLLHAGRPRRYYHLTDAGRRRLCEKEAEWRAYTTAVARVLKGGA